jgi:integrase
MIKTKFTGVYYRDLQNNDRVFIITYKLNGKFKKEKVGSTKEGITAIYASKIRAKRTSIDRLKEDAPMFLNQKLPSFDECFNMYYKSIETKSDSPNTKRRYELHVKPTFRHIKIDDITTQMVEDFKIKSKKLKSQKTTREYAPKTINDWINTIGTVFNYMISKKDLNVKNPAIATKVEREKVDNDRERYLELNEIKKIWDVLDNRQELFDNKINDDVTENIKVFLALSLSTGARLRSVLTISKADINLNTNTVIIKNHKANRTYNGYIHPNYRELIAKRIENLSPIDYVVNSSPEELNRNSINKVLQPIFDKLFNQGLKPEDSKRRVVIHTLRHTFASQLAIAEIPIYTIMRLMDHADISQTIRYAKLSSSSGRDAVFNLKLI